MSQAVAGFQVLVPDLRGYGLSGKPDAAEACSLPTLAGTCWRSSPTDPDQIPNRGLGG
jgi:pimeloyl-ACP methyl ester carboxylesterase